MTAITKCDILFTQKALIIKIEAQGGTNMSKFWKKTVSLICTILCVTLFVSQTLWSAAYQDRDRSHEVIILFDLSSSDQWYEVGLLSADTLWQLMDGLPLEWHVGLITFDSNIVNSIPPRTDARASVHAVLSDPSYAYTYQIPALFSDSALSHTVVLLANNEMAVVEVDTAYGSARLANTVVEELILIGLSVHSLNLSDEYVQTVPNYLDVRDLAAPEFSFISDLLPGQNIAQEFSMYLFGEPGNRSRRMLIAAEHDVEHVFVSFNGYTREVEFGRRVGIIEVLDASDDNVRIDFSSVGLASASLASVQESSAINLSNDNQPMRFWLSGLAEESLFLSSFFNGALVPLFMDGTTPQLELVIPNVDEPIPQEPIAPAPMTPVVVTINLPLLPDAIADDEVVDNNTDEEDEEVTSPILAEDPPATYTPELYSPGEIASYPYDDDASFGFNLPIFWIIFVAILLALILFFFKHKAQDKKSRTKKARGQKSLQKKVDNPPPESIPALIPAITQKASNPEELLEFAKKFDIYLSQTDTVPAAFALFKLGRAKEISLQKILRKCSNIRISDDLTNTKDIRFSVDSSNTLKVVNNSSFKVCVKENPLQINESRVLLQGDNVHIFFEGDRELVLSPRFLYQMSKS